MGLFIPFLLGGAIVSGMAYGLYRGSGGAHDLRHAGWIARQAQAKYTRRAEELEVARIATNVRAEAYARAQAEVVDRILTTWIRLVERLQRKGKLNGVTVLAGIDAVPHPIQGYQSHKLRPAELLGGSAQATIAGIAASRGAAGLVGSIGISGTGAAISGLTGAAARSATLAWLGGGSLAAGGFGVAGGTLISGGLTIAPAVLMAGFAVAKKGQAALTAAARYAAEAEVEGAKLDTARAFLWQVCARIQELDDVLSRLSARAGEALSQVPVDTFDGGRDEDVLAFQRAGQLVLAVGDVLRTPVLKAESELDPAGADLRVRYRELLEARP